MNHPLEYYTSRPNLLRVAVEIASYGEGSWCVANALVQALAAYAGTELPAPLPEPERPTNNERFNALLNGCESPRAVYNALAAFAEARKEAR